MKFSVYRLKPRFQGLLSPLVDILATRRVTPNQLTISTALVMVAYGIALAIWPQSAGLWTGLVCVMPLRMALNALDGLLAHRTGQTTPLGAMLNEVCDVVADLALYLPVAAVTGVSAPLAVVAAAGAAVSEHAGLSALAAGSSRRFDGPMGKSDRAVAYAVIGVLIGSGVTSVWIECALALVCVLLFWTTFNRLRAAAAPPTP